MAGRRRVDTPGWWLALAAAVVLGGLAAGAGLGLLTRRTRARVAAAGRPGMSGGVTGA